MGVSCPLVAMYNKCEPARSLGTLLALSRDKMKRECKLNKEKDMVMQGGFYHDKELCETRVKD